MQAKRLYKFCSSKAANFHNGHFCATIYDTRKFHRQTAMEAVKMIDRYLSIWEIAHRWRDINPDKSDPADLPLNIQDTLRYICCGILAGKLALFEMVVMQSPDKYNSGFRSEIRPYYLNEHPAEIEDCLYRKYDKNAINAFFIEAANLFEYCLDRQVIKSDTGNTSVDYPECWWHLTGYTDISCAEPDDGNLPLVVANQPLRPNQIDKQICQAIAKTIWDFYPTMTITAMTKHNAILNHGGGKLYTGKNTLRDWVREVAPENVRNNRGRPKNDKPSKDVA